MLNLQAAEQFIAAGEALESRFVGAALRIWQRARIDLFEVVASRLNVQPIIAAVGREIASVGADLAPAARSLARSYLDRQLASARENVALGEQLLDDAALAPLSNGLPAWQAATFGRFLSDIGRLDAAGEAPITIAAVVTAHAATPQSAYGYGETALQLAAEAALWQALNGSLSSAYERLSRVGRQRYQKQAIAALDQRTTPCCRGVHGQIREIDEPFTTSGRPAFAGEQLQPPFHYRCRTTIALYTPAMEAIGPTTEALRAAARALSSSR